MPDARPQWLAATSDRASRAVDRALGARMDLGSAERALLAIAAVSGGFMPDSLAREFVPPGAAADPRLIVDAAWRRLEGLGIVDRHPELQCRQIVSPATLEALGLPPGWVDPARRHDIWRWFLLADFVLHYGARPAERPAPLWLVGAAEKREALVADAGGEECMPATDPSSAALPFAEGWPVGCRHRESGCREWVFGLLAGGGGDHEPVTAWLERHAQLLRGLQDNGLRTELRWITGGDSAARACDAAERWRSDELGVSTAVPGEERRDGYRAAARFVERLLPPLVEVRRHVLRGSPRAIERWQPNYHQLGAAADPAAPAQGVPGLLAFHRAIAETIGAEHWSYLKRLADIELGRAPAVKRLDFRFVPWISDRARALAAAR